MQSVKQNSKVQRQPTVYMLKLTTDAKLNKLPRLSQLNKVHETVVKYVILLQKNRRCEIKLIISTIQQLTTEITQIYIKLTVVNAPTKQFDEYS